MKREILCGIYCIENIINNKKYIGHAKDIHKRWNVHKSLLNNDKHHNKYLQNAWKKYGEENFRFSIICLCSNENRYELEEEYIVEYSAHFNNGGYNLTTGGENNSGRIITAEFRQKVGDFHRGKTISQEQREYYSKLFSGDGNPFYGKTHSDETKERISKDRKLKGYSFGGNNCKAKKVICNNIIYGCAKDCADFYDVKNCTLRSWIRGDRPMPQKFIDLGLAYI